MDAPLPGRRAGELQLGAGSRRSATMAGPVGLRRGEELGDWGRTGLDGRRREWSRQLTAQACQACQGRCVTTPRRRRRRQTYLDKRAAPRPATRYCAALQRECCGRGKRWDGVARASPVLIAQSALEPRRPPRDWDMLVSAERWKGARARQSPHQATPSRLDQRRSRPLRIALGSGGHNGAARLRAGGMFSFAPSPVQSCEPRLAETCRRRRAPAPVPGTGGANLSPKGVDNPAPRASCGTTRSRDPIISKVVDDGFQPSCSAHPPAGASTSPAPAQHRRHCTVPVAPSTVAPVRAAHTTHPPPACSSNPPSHPILSTSPLRRARLPAPSIPKCISSSSICISISALSRAPGTLCPPPFSHRLVSARCVVCYAVAQGAIIKHDTSEGVSV